MEISNGRLVERRPIVARKQVKARYKTVLTKAEYKAVADNIVEIGNYIGFVAVIGMMAFALYALASMGF